MRQIEVSRTLVFDAPRHARGFFEALVADNLDIGRPDTVELIFHGPRHLGRPPKLDCVPKTKIVTRGTEVTVNAFYKNSRIKQYLKNGRALRIETVINSPDDLRCHRRLAHLDELQSKARAVNRRLLDTERVGQGCVLASPAFERIAQPSLAEDGRSAPRPCGSRRRDAELDNTQPDAMAGALPASRLLAVYRYLLKPGASTHPDRTWPLTSRHRGVFGAVAKTPAPAGSDRRGWPDRQHREETRIRQPLFVSHHRPGVGACDDQDVGASAVRRADHPQRPRVRGPASHRGGDSIHQGRQLLHRGRRPGGPGPDRRCLVAGCGCRAAGPGLPTMDLHRVPVLSGWTSTSNTAADSATGSPSISSSTAAT